MRRYGLPVTEGAGIPHPDAEGITEEVIHDVVVEFYQKGAGGMNVWGRCSRHTFTNGSPTLPG